MKAGEIFKLNRKGADGQMAKVDVSLLDLPYDFDSLMAAGTMSGSGAIIVLDDTRDIVATLANLAEFYAHESCGQCTPCREGALWMSKALHRMTHGEGRKADADYLLRYAPKIKTMMNYFLSRSMILSNSSLIDFKLRPARELD